MVMQFIYLGQCQVGQEELNAFIVTGKDLAVNGLLEDESLEEIPETANTDQQETSEKIKQTAPSNVVSNREVVDDFL